MEELVGGNKLQRTLGVIFEEKIKEIAKKNDVDMIVAADMFIAEVSGETNYADYTTEQKAEYADAIVEIKDMINITY